MSPVWVATTRRMGGTAWGLLAAGRAAFQTTGICVWEIVLYSMTKAIQVYCRGKSNAFQGSRKAVVKHVTSNNNNELFDKCGRFMSYAGTCLRYTYGFVGVFWIMRAMSYISGLFSEGCEAHPAAGTMTGCRFMQFNPPGATLTLDFNWIPSILF